MHSELDGYDRKILALLQEDASLSSAQIAEQVGLSQSPCWRRIQRMKDEGIIRGQVTLLDRKKLGLTRRSSPKSNSTLTGVRTSPNSPRQFAVFPKCWNVMC